MFTEFAGDLVKAKGLRKLEKVDKVDKEEKGDTGEKGAACCRRGRAAACSASSRLSRVVCRGRAAYWDCGLVVFPRCCEFGNPTRQTATLDARRHPIAP